MAWLSGAGKKSPIWHKEDGRLITYRTIYLLHQEEIQSLHSRLFLQGQKKVPALFLLS